MFSRSEALLGHEAIERLARSRVAVFGVGGVGGWCAEALVRTGVGRLLVVDDDVVRPSNLNRQCPATSRTLGRAKVEALAERLAEINPSVEIETRCERFLPDSDASAFAGCDAVVDAIDSVDCKAKLILAAVGSGLPFVSSMGAALRIDPTRVEVRRFDRVEGDGLARALRQRFKRLGTYPAHPFACVCSTEPPRHAEGETRGSLMSVTATFGMCLASETIRNLSRE